MSQHNDAPHKDVSHEFLEYILTDWAKNLYMLNNKTRITDDASRRDVEAELHEKWYPNNNRGLTRAQSASEQGFSLFVHGLCETLGRVSDKATDAVCNSSLVDAWRTAVWRNHYQQRYSLFEQFLQETLETSGEAAALAQFPQKNGASAAALIKTLDIYGYATRFDDENFVKNLIRKTEGPKDAAPKPSSTP